MMKASNSFNKFSIDYKQILLNSMLISIVSFIEDTIVSFCIQYYTDYKKPKKSIIRGALRFLNKKQGENNKYFFENVVYIRNDFVHNNAIINYSKDWFLLENNIKIDSKTNKMKLSTDFIYKLINEAEDLFNDMFKQLYEIKISKLENKLSF